MSFRNLFPAASWFWRSLTGRYARRIYLAVALLLFISSAVVRIYTYVLTRRMEAVIAGLGKLEIDKSTEEEVVRTVPYLVRLQWEGPIKRTPETGSVDLGTERLYIVMISNESSWMKFGRLIEPLVSCCAKVEFTKDGYERGWIFTLTNWLGYRYVDFRASVVLLDGKVSRISYGVADRLAFPRQFGQIVSVTSVHSFWAPYRREFEVQSTDDESPQFRVGGGENSIGVSYTYDAPRDLIEHAFRVDLSCFWGLQGCRHVKQIARELLQDKNMIELATLTRLKSAKPCPDRILTGRARYLPDAGILLLESKGFETKSIVQGGQRVEGTVTKYRLVEALRGGFSKDLESVWGQDTVPFPGDYSRRLANNGLKRTIAGDKVLAFSNLHFDSCGIVPATPSAVSAVKNVAPAPRRMEDEIIMGLQ